MNQQIKNIDETVVVNSIQRMLQFQRKWRSITMLFYVVTTVGTILCSTGATIFGALNYGQYAAVLAAGQRHVSTLLRGVRIPGSPQQAFPSVHEGKREHPRHSLLPFRDLLLPPPFHPDG